MASPTSVVATRGIPRTSGPLVTEGLTDALAELTFPASEPLLTEALEGISLLSHELAARRTTTLKNGTRARACARSGVVAGTPAATVAGRVASSSGRSLEKHRVLPLSSDR
jgi:hypothetical protein